MYDLRIYLGRLPNSSIEKRVINGQEQECMVIPCKDSQLTRTRKGYYCLRLRALDASLQAKASHSLSLTFRSKEENDLYRIKTHGDSRCICGIMTPVLAQSVAKNKPTITEVMARGYVCIQSLSNDVYRLEGAHTSVNCAFKSVGNNGNSIVCRGQIRLSDIDQSDFVINKSTGKANLPCVFKNLPTMDNNSNTHALYVVKPDGTEYEIGRFREMTPQPKRLAAAPPKQTPRGGETIINGLTL